MGIAAEIKRIKNAKASLKSAINSRGGSLTTELIDDYAAAVTALPTGEGADLSFVTVTAADMREGVVAADADGQQIVGTMPDAAVITAMAKIYVTAGYLAENLEFADAAAITENLANVTAASTDVLEFKQFVDAEGKVVYGSITDWGAHTGEGITVDGNTVTFLAGYRGADRTVRIATSTPSMVDNVITIPEGYAEAQTFTVAEAKAPTVSGNVVTVYKGYQAAQDTVEISKVAATRSDNVVTIPAGYHDANTVTVPVAGAVSVSGNVVIIPAGYNATAQTVTVGTAKAAQTYTPSTADQTIAAGTYLSGVQTIKGDANFTEENIADGVSMWGKVGKHKGGGASMDFYKCAAVYGPYEVKTVVISGCPTEAVNGTYLPTESTTTDYDGTPYPVYKHESSEYYYYYDTNNWMNWVLGTDYAGNMLYMGSVGSSFSDPDWNTVDGMTGAYGTATADADVPKTWDGYKAVLTAGVYSFEETLTTGLTWTANRPEELGIYSADGSIKTEWLIRDYPTDGLVLFAPLTERLDRAEIGGELIYDSSKVVIENGMAKFLSQGNTNGLLSNRLPFDLNNTEITFFYQFMVLPDVTSGATRRLVGMQNSTTYAYIQGNKLVFFDNRDNYGVDITPNVLYTVGMVCKEGKWTVRLDNELKFSNISKVVFYTNRTWVDFCSNYDGYLKNVLVYNRALNDDEIEQLYNKFKPTERYIYVTSGATNGKYVAEDNGGNTASNYPIVFRQASALDIDSVIDGVVAFDTSISKWVLYSEKDPRTILYRATTDGVSGLTGTWEVANGVGAAPSILLIGESLPEWNNV